MPHRRDGPAAAPQPPQPDARGPCSPSTSGGGGAGFARRREPAEPVVAFASTEDFISKVEIYRGRHSVVWNVVCKETRKPLILKAYMKVRAPECACYVGACARWSTNRALVRGSRASEAKRAAASDGRQCRA